MKCWRSGGEGPGEGPDEKAHQEPPLPLYMAHGTHAYETRVSYRQLSSAIWDALSSSGTCY